jgi:hypothetical protein
MDAGRAQVGAHAGFELRAGGRGERTARPGTPHRCGGAPGVETARLLPGSLLALKWLGRRFGFLGGLALKWLGRRFGLLGGLALERRGGRLGFLGGTALERRGGWFGLLGGTALERLSRRLGLLGGLALERLGGWFRFLGWLTSSGRRGAVPVQGGNRRRGLAGTHALGDGFRLAL